MRRTEAPEAAIREICALLAAGLVRLRQVADAAGPADLQQHHCSAGGNEPDGSKVGVDFAPARSMHGRERTMRERRP